MSDYFVLNLFVADDSTAAVDDVAKTLVDAGYKIESLHSGSESDIRHTIDYKPVDLIIIHQTEYLPSIPQVRHHLDNTAEKDIPIIVALDPKDHQSPVHYLREGADNFFYRGDPEHLVITVRKELAHVWNRKNAHSSEINFKESEARWRMLLEKSSDAIAYIHEGVHSHISQAYLKLFGYTKKEDLASTPLLNLCTPEYRDALKSLLRRTTREGKAVEPVDLIVLANDGSVFPIQMECSPTRMNEEPCMQILVRDKTPQQEEAKLKEEFSRYDELTGVHSRSAFIENLESHQNGSILYILLSDHRSISQELGYEAADQLSIDIAKQLKKIVGQDGLVARFASAIFTVYLPSDSALDPQELAERILKAIEEHVTHASQKLLTTTCCIGVSQFGEEEDSSSVKGVLFNADRACEMARKKGGNQVQVFDLNKSTLKGPEEDTSQDDISLQLIREALQNPERLSLRYQPIANFQSAAEARYKVYLRIMDQHNKPLSLVTLGSVGERHDLMKELDRWTIQQALQRLVDMHKQEEQLPILFIRISKNSLEDPDFHRWLNDQASQISLSPSQLVMEVNENSAEACYQSVKKMRNDLLKIKCGFALSHFGGKSNSAFLLQELRPDYIKLDSALIEKVAKGKNELIGDLTKQADSTNTLVIATDVSTAPQMANIWQFGIVLVQGSMVADIDTEMNFDFTVFK